MEEIAQVYARALFEVARERDRLDEVREQLGQVDDALAGDRNLSLFFFSPYFSTEEKKRGLHSMLDGADPAIENFLEALVERHRMPAIHRISLRYEDLWQDANRLLPVQVTSAVELDAATVERLGSQIGEQTGRRVDLSSTVDPDILGGIVLRVGNSILDASIRNRLDQLRRNVAQA